MNKTLQARGLDPASMTNDEIAAALESDADGVEIGQSAFDKGGRAAPASLNGDMILRQVPVSASAAVENRQGALAKISDAKGEYRTESGEAVTISRTARKVFSGSFPAGRLRLAGAIPDLLQSSVVYNSDMPQRAYAVALAEIDGQNVIVRMVLNNDGSGSEKLYALEGFEVAPIAWRDATAEVSDQEQVGAKPAMGSAPEINSASAVAEINALPSGAAPLFQTRRGSIRFPAGGPAAGGTIINLSLSEDPLFAAEIAALEIELMALATTNLRMLSMAAHGRVPGAESSMLKIKGTQIRQRVDALTRRAYGAWAQALASDIGPTEGQPRDAAGMLGANRAWLNNRKLSIYGGSTEIQRGIIAAALAKE
nr:acyl-CoA dehydrogenase family protein [Paracoccus salsus]